jgi:pimeloyl-ACP methyl ester carboxylesterase
MSGRHHPRWLVIRQTVGEIADSSQPSIDSGNTWTISPSNSANRERRVRGEFVDIDGTRLYYFAAGSRGIGEPIVLLHGFPTSSHLWNGVVPLLPLGHRVVVVDLLGYGRSDRPEGRDLSIRGHAERVITLLDALSINYACVVGHDLGGGIAQAMAVHWPTRVSRLCLVSPVAFDDWPAREVRMARAMLPLTRHLPATWLLSFLRTELLRGYAESERGQHSIERYVKPFATQEGRDAFMEHLLALDSKDTVALEPRLKDIVAPTAIVSGTGDPFHSRASGERLQRAIAGSTSDVIAEGRHFSPEEAPERIAGVITALLAR